ncbi:2-oxoglutarate (2OG) and Fe(II)-dependent oxygenase superfamily protein [Melia azedarach]|uniref:2-oxoglutarate (2OG) and Fe(II)-dependent oxygenase superfamily protein n=1 Tax=Melia azedarach TaxID=155640 RepID=A0ACC1XQT5_MELAZ|nr:2-oxoglutarate (2OG) and Fe(II)-dependent oxygenase superfamily protein [Melia azedarach]
MADHLNANGANIKVYNLECIDLSNPDIDQSAALIKKVCLDSGIFYVTNHGISDELFDEGFAQTKRFFAMPENEKMKILWNENHYRGYQPPVQKGYVEVYTTAAGVLKDGVVEDDPTNLWPSADVLPEWKESIQKYVHETLNVGRRVAKLIARALGLDDDFFDLPQMFGDDNATVCSLMHYTDQENHSSEEKLGRMGHYDVSLITLLATDDALGIQICRDKEAKPQSWEYVLPKKRAFIVFVGEVLERLSGDTFRPVLHRVVYFQERYSIGVFLLPSYDCLVENSLPPNSEENSSKYTAEKFKDFLDFRYVDVTAEIIQKQMEAA